MKSVIHVKHLAFVLVSLLTLSPWVQATQWYHVELVVFEQLDTISDEKWPEMAELDIAPLTPDMANNSIQPSLNQTLVAASQRLQRSPRYEVLYHRSWQQPALKKAEAQFIRVQNENELVDGKVRLYKSTYLHAQLDLWLKKNTAALTRFSDAKPFGEANELPRNPHLLESRRVKSKKLYYFDHPVLGALLELTPVDTPQAVEANQAPLQTYSLPTEAAADINQ
jgi:hypothetical protein